MVSSGEVLHKQSAVAQSWTFCPWFEMNAFATITSSIVINLVARTRP